MEVIFNRLRHFQLASLAAALLCGSLLLVAAPSLAQRPADADPPDLRGDLDIKTETGAFTARILFEAPKGDIIFPLADWLKVQDVTFAATGGQVQLPKDGRLAPEVHRNEDLRISVSGRLPARNGQATAVAWSAQASHIVGPAWFPVDDVKVRDHEVSVSTPANQIVAATGTLAPDSVVADTRNVRVTFTGRSEDFGLFIGPYVIEETRHRDLRLRTYFETANPQLSQRYFVAAAAYLDRYEREIGPYPYDGFSVVSAPLPVGLGFAGLTYVSRDILSHPYMQGRSLAHEVLHSWWGNAVGIDYGTGNWAEGLTTFQADYALAEDLGDEAARKMRVGWIRDLDRLSNAGMRPLTAFRSASHATDQSEGYGKAAFVFYMLRDQIGPKAFSAGVSAFYRDNRHSIAGWNDLQLAFEGAAGHDLSWFFDQWVDRAGLPRLSVSEVRWQGSLEGPGELVATIRQEAPHYRLRLPVVVESASGAERRTADVMGNASTVRFALSQRPLALRLDPGLRGRAAAAAGRTCADPPVAQRCVVHRGRGRYSDGTDGNRRKGDGCPES